MKRIAFLIFGVAVASFVLADKAKYSFDVAGQPMGSSTFEKTISKNGNLTVRSIVNMTTGVTLDNTDVYSPDGSLFSCAHKQPLKGGGMRIVSKKYYPGGCTLTISEKGVAKVKKLPLDKKLSTRDSSAWWFVKTKPKPGAKIEFWNVEDNAEKWRLKTVTYVGPATVKVNGKVYRGHLVIMPNKSKYVLDDHGMPLRMAIGPKGLAAYTRQGLK